MLRWNSEHCASEAEAAKQSVRVSYGAGVLDPVQRPCKLTTPVAGSLGLNRCENSLYCFRCFFSTSEPVSEADRRSSKQNAMYNSEGYAPIFFWQK